MTFPSLPLPVTVPELENKWQIKKELYPGYGAPIYLRKVLTNIFLFPAVAIVIVEGHTGTVTCKYTCKQTKKQSKKNQILIVCTVEHPLLT